MEHFIFENLYDLAEYMFDCIEDKSEVAAVLFFEDAKELMTIILSEYDVDIGTIDITNAEYDGYDREYYVSLMSDGMISVEPAFGKDMYLYTCADVLLIDGEASYSIVERNVDSECFEIVFDDFDEHCDEDDIYTCCDCDECDCCEDEEDDIKIHIDINCETDNLYNLLNYLFNI